MDDIHGVEMLECLHNMRYIGCNKILIEIAYFFEYGIQFTYISIFLNNIDPFLVEEETVHLKDVGMLDMTVNL